ncbi:MAG: hypothetical protein GVY32_00150 [Gammaproteobacteria bacterium]|jgi:hypothetical protein|nr:hypothetical protein [Gammaproteobacteria bacterium]
MKRLIAILFLSAAGAATIHFAAGDRSPPEEGASNRIQAFSPWAPVDQAERVTRRAVSPGSAGDRAIPLRTAAPPEREPRRIELPLPGGKSLSGAVSRTHRHPNGDTSLRVESASGDTALVTLGQSGVFARIHAGGDVIQVTTDHSGTWMLDLSTPGFEVDHFGHDVISAARSNRPGDETAAWSPPADLASHSGDTITRIDVMMIHPPALAQRYPGSLLATRFNHFVGIANQALVDSRIDAQVELVHFEQTGYNRHQANNLALRDLGDALDGESIPGLAGLANTREQKGADIVAMIWPHDIETRGSCGIAYFPSIESGGQGEARFGVHITNDGVSNWSVCSDAVFAHELGHNLGAQHQRDTIASPDPQSDNFAWTRDGRWHTLMGSFGTGHVDRYRRLDVYSNPAVQCGGEPCGSTQTGNGADNAGLMNDLAPVIAAYAGEAAIAEAHVDPSDGDQDGDGTPDRNDPFPFDPYDGGDPPEVEPELVFDDRRLASPPGDARWELLVVSSGNDRVLSWGLDGRYRGVVVAPEPVNPGPVLTEYSDLLADDAGRLYLLASEDLRRFDRLSGRLIDVFLDSALPGPRTLKSSFPRAMGWLSGDRLAVLGDNAIEVYDEDGEHLNPLTQAEPSTDPMGWSRAMDLPLRALAQFRNQLYVAEAGQNRIMAFSALNGFRGLDLAGPGEGGLTDPWDMAVGPDDLLYVANGSADNVLRFDPEAGEFVDVFVDAGSGGLDFARALAFGPQGDLFVASRNSNQVLRFDPSGNFTGVATEQLGGDALEAPENLLVAPVVDEVGPGHSGHYFVPERGGEGWLLEILDADRAAISWFTYPPASFAATEQAWVVGVGDIEGSRIVFDDVLATRLADPDRPIATANIEVLPWGTLTLDFNNCRYGRASFDSPLFESSGELDFVRLIAIDGLPCGSVPQPPSPAAPGISGQWSDPESSGQGWFMQELGEGRVFTAWFTYDTNGEQAWVVGEGLIDGKRLEFDELTLTGGTDFGGDFDADAVDYTPWGELVFEFENCDLATATYSSVLPQFGNGELKPRRLTDLDGLDCSLPE